MTRVPCSLATATLLSVQRSVPPERGFEPVSGCERNGLKDQHVLAALTDLNSDYP